MSKQLLSGQATKQEKIKAQTPLLKKQALPGDDVHYFNNPFVNDNFSSSGLSSSSSPSASFEIAPGAIDPSSVRGSLERYGDPIMDTTFKLLFGTNQNKDLLISIINNLLDFKGDKEIVEVDINNRDLLISRSSPGKDVSEIVGAVDILCTNKGRQKIAVEIQGQKIKSSLAGQQHNMANLILGQVREGSIALYHTKLLETHIVVIAKSDLFTGDTAIKDQALFELDVYPMIRGTQEPMPYNKMFWKFFELQKFKQHPTFSNINETSSLKEQWLEFFVQCGAQKDVPNRNEIIKKAYNVMETMTWSDIQQSMYWKELQKDASLIAATTCEKSAQDRVMQEGDLKDKLEDDINYTQEHIEDSASEIREDLGIMDVALIGDGMNNGDSGHLG